VRTAVTTEVFDRDALGELPSLDRQVNPAALFCIVHRRVREFIVKGDGPTIFLTEDAMGRVEGRWSPNWSRIDVSAFSPSS
jgi:hypothetical protein